MDRSQGQAMRWTLPRFGLLLAVRASPSGFRLAFVLLPRVAPPLVPRIGSTPAWHRVVPSGLACDANRLGWFLAILRASSVFHPWQANR